MSGLSRRDFLRGCALLGLGAAGGAGVAGALADDTVWQIDPYRCIQCGKCAINCVLDESAVKAVHVHAMCGHCDLCTAFFEPETVDLDTGAENQLCPTGAIVRRFVEEPYFSYEIDETLCIGCAKCVEGCEMFGNGSMFLQIRHDRCTGCNACSIADECPSRAIRRVPASTPYLLKSVN
jgi:electron transport complex protein RnfB